ncbi:MAG TPA: class I SAM-dependent methyltransferase [Bryobacteraceae bacterium]
MALEISSQPPAASFRDPAGCLFSWRGRILRAINAAGMADLTAFLESKSARKHLEAGSVAGTRLLSGEEAASLRADPAVAPLVELFAGAIAEHERISFPSFPYEWSPEMLYAAGMLTLDLAADLLADGVGLKDATPYNVLFRGPEPVFIDVLSFERRDPGDSTWLPYAQFVRTFLLPLAANRYFGVGLDQILITHRDGLEPEELYRWLKPLQKIRPPFLSMVSMPAWLGKRHNQDDQSIYRKQTGQDPERARFVLNMLLRGLRRSLKRLEPAAGKQSVWSDYMVSNNNYTAEHFAAKQSFVDAAVKEFRPRRALDVGCNTGHFSAIAARSGAEVVALDYDPVVLGDVWRNARREKLNILPLAVNLTRPTPGMGWRNRENASFLDRARGHFDAVLMLAVIHHMLVTERVPLAEIIELAAELTTGILVIEFIAPDDSMFRRLTRGREELHKDLTPELFERVCARRFDVIRTQHLEGTSRWLYLLKRKAE